MAIRPNAGLFDQLYGFDLGNMGAPVEPGVAGNPLPYFIDTNYPPQIPASLRIPPEVADAAEIVNDEEVVPPQYIPQGAEQASGDAWPDPMAFTLGAFGAQTPPTPAPNPARQSRMDDVQYAGNQVAAQNQEEEEAEEVDAPAIGFSPDDTTYSPYSYVDPTEFASIEAPALGGVPTPGQGFGTVDAPAGGVETQEPGSYSQYSSAAVPSLSTISQAGIPSQNAGSIEDAALAGVNAATPMTGTPVGGYAGYGADLSARDTAEYNAQSAQSIAQNEQNNQAVNQAALTNTIGNDLIAGMNTMTPQQYAETVTNAQAQMAQSAQAARDNQAANQLASNFAGIPAGAPTPEPASERAANGAYSAAPTTASYSPMMGSPGLAASLGSVEASPTLTAGPTQVSAPAAPGVNPGNVGGFASRGLGVGLANQAATQAAEDADKAESIASQARADNARAAGFAPGLGAALGGRSSPEETGSKVSLSQISDDNFGLGNLGKGAAPSLSGLSSDRSSIDTSNLTERNASTFVNGLFGGIDKSKASAFTNPVQSLNDIVGSLTDDELSPYSGRTGIAPLGNDFTSFNTSEVSRADNIAAENDAINQAGNINGVNANSFGMTAAPFSGTVSINPDPYGGLASFSDDEDDDEDGVGGYGSSSSSSSLGGSGGSSSYGGALGGNSIGDDTGVGATSSLGSSTGSGSFGFSQETNDVGGFGGLGGFSSNVGGFSSGGSLGGSSSLGGFGGDSNVGGFGDGSSGGGGFGGGFSTGNTSENSFGNDGGFGSAGGSTAGVGGSVGSQSDDTGSFSDFSGFGGFDGLGDGGFT